MAEENTMTDGLDADEVADDTPVKRRLTIKMPSPVVYFFVGPFVLIFAIYIVLTKVLLTSDLQHEAKLEQVLKMDEQLSSIDEDQIPSETEGELVEEEAGFLDTHNYFQFPMAFAVNIPDTKKKPYI